MAISKSKKESLVTEFSELLSNSKMVVYAKYSGLSVKDLEELRAAAREANVKIKIVKNRLLKVAMKEIAVFKNTETSGLTGQLLYALGSDEDFDAAKVLAKFAKTHSALELQGGFDGEGKNLSEEEVKTLGNLPTKNELIAEVVEMLLSPINGIVSGLENRKDAPAGEPAEKTAGEAKPAEAEESATASEKSAEVEKSESAPEKPADSEKSE